MKRTACFLCCLALVMGLFLPHAVLADAAKSGDVTDTITWELTDDGVLYIRVLTKMDCAWAQRGHEITAFSFALPEGERAKKRTFPAPELMQTAAAFLVSGESFCYTFRRDEGLLSGMNVVGEKFKNNEIFVLPAV